MHSQLILFTCYSKENAAKKSTAIDLIDEGAVSKPRKRKARSKEDSFTTESRKRQNHSVYKGVSWRKQDSKYLAYVHLDKTRALGETNEAYLKRFAYYVLLKWALGLGTYKLESDAALVSDLGNQALKGIQHNFSSENDYRAARTHEMLKTRLSLDAVGDVESLKEKAAAKIARIRRAIASEETARQESNQKSASETLKSESKNLSFR
jgi:hypothetical protein